MFVFKKPVQNAKVNFTCPNCGKTRCDNQLHNNPEDMRYITGTKFNKNGQFSSFAAVLVCVSFPCTLCSSETFSVASVLAEVVSGVVVGKCLASGVDALLCVSSLESRVALVTLTTSSSDVVVLRLLWSRGDVC